MMKRTITCLVLGAAMSAMAADGPMPLPAGHPEIAHRSPATMPESAAGSLKISVVQRTANAPSPEGDKVVVHFYQGDKVIKHAQVAVDAKGLANVADFTLTREPVQAMVMVEHGGITYQAVSPVMSSGTPSAEVEVPIYEVSKETPAWRIPMRHLIASNTPAGVRIVEMLALNNPSDRTWIGTDAGEHEKGATLVLRLPDGATNLELGDGFAADTVHFHNGTMYTLAPMTPGMTSYQFAYTIPVKGGKVQIPIVAPAVTQQLIVFVPDDGTEIKATGLQPQETRKTEDGMMRMLSAAGLPAGQGANLTITGLANSATASGASWTLPQILGVAAVGIVLVGGMGFILLKKPVKQPETKS